MPRPRLPHRRTAILDAAEQLVLEQGFDATSVASVAARAGIGKGAVYLEFESKTDILDALLQRAGARMQARVDAGLTDDVTLSDAYRSAVRALLDDRLMTAAFLDDRGILGSHVSAVTDGRYRARHLLVIEWLRRLQGQGRLRTDIDAEHLALALSSATIGLLSANALLGPLDPEQLEGAFTALARMVSAFEI
ncbi:TetR/AcrR family transcriptional regulator [Microbacterium aurantiacum]|uniref:TetR/AcrR family transcriptional regulator n=1 Tax=Microbacterium aurantiacum TaxID=162393 RepID=UPI000C80A955|nr:TetR/AcrR family transcriptional regulator [Microbacterium aurantiacum]